MCAPSVIQSALAGLSRRELLALSALGVACAAVPAAEKKPVVLGNVLDLTHTLSPEFPIWPGGAPIRITNLAKVTKDNLFYANKWEVVEHHGTHLDAPSHFAAKGANAEKIPASALIVPVAVIDISERVRKDADALLLAEDLEAWEKKHGKLPKGCAVFLNSGWDAKAGDSKSFLGLDGSKTLHFPGYSVKAVQFLLEEREVVGLGTDTLSLDHGPSKDFAVHKLWLGKGKWGLECVANLGKLPAAGATVFVGAPKVAGASGGPARVMATW